MCVWSFYYLLNSLSLRSSFIIRGGVVLISIVAYCMTYFSSENIIYTAK